MKEVTDVHITFTEVGASEKLYLKWSTDVTGWFPYLFRRFVLRPGKDGAAIIPYRKAEHMWWRTERYLRGIDTRGRIDLEPY